MDIRVVRISAVTDITRALRQFNNYFPRSIESRVGDLNSYAVKLSKYAFVYAAKVSGEVVGIIVFYANDLSTEIAFLSQIAVSVEYQNKGIGSLLLRFSWDICKEYGMKKMKLEVDTINSSAISYYEKLSFTKVDQPSLDSQYMIKELT